MAPLIQAQQSQINTNTLTQICLSPLKRPDNGMQKDEKFLKYNTQGKQNTIAHSKEQQQQTKEEDKKQEESLLQQEQIEYIEDSLQDNFDNYRKLFDSDELAFMNEIEDMCTQSQLYPINCTSSSKVLYNKNFNQQISSTSSQQSSSQVISPSNTNHSKQGNDTSSANSFSQHTKENDCPKVKESNFKRIVKTNVSISNTVQPNLQQQSQISQSQKPAISQLLNWFDNSFEKKNNSSNSEFFQGLETEDSLATTHLSALSNCTPHSVSQNILTLFSPQTNSSAGSTINFNNTNNSLKQAIQSLSWQSGENSSLIFEQIKQQIDLQKQQLLQQQHPLEQLDSEIVSIKQQQQQELQVNQQIEASKKVKVMGTQAVKNSIQPIIIENLN